MRNLFIFVAALILGGCGQRQQTVEGPRPVKITTAVDAAFVQKDFPGMATPDDAVNLAFRLNGQLLDVPIAQGQSVRKGQLLAELDPRDMQLQVSADRTAFAEASSQLARMKRLLEHGAVSQQEYEAAQTRYAQVKAAYDNSNDLLKDTKLYAPFASVIEDVYIDNYQRVQSGEPIMRLVNPVTRKVRFTLSEGNLYLLSLPTTRFSVTFDNYRNVKFPAVLKEYSRTSSDASGFPVTLRLTEVDTMRYRISPGMSCTVTMTSADPIPSAVSLPLTAIYAPASGGSFVWIVDADNRVQLRPVKLGQPFGRDRVLIDSGVELGDRVVIAGVYQLREGESVKILK